MATISSYDTRAGRRYRVRYRKPDRSQTDKRGFRTKRDAELFAASVEIDKATGTYIDPSRSRAVISELGATWLAGQSHLKPSTLRTVEIAWRKHVEPRWGTVAVADVEHSGVQTWIGELSAKPLGATSVLRAHGVLAGILDTAVTDRRIPSNPARGVNLPRKVRKEHRYLTHEQVWAFADAAGEHRTLVLLLAYTGLRWGEAVGLRTRDVNLLRRRINVSVNAVQMGGHFEIGTPKTHTRRTVSFPEFLAAPLGVAARGKQPDELVFANEHGAHLRRPDPNHGWFERARVAVGLERFTPHDLRHTTASLAISAGANVKALQRMLGHASAAVTLDVYADLFEDDLEVVSARFDEVVARSDVGKMWAEASATGS